MGELEAGCQETEAQATCREPPVQYSPIFPKLKQKQVRNKGATHHLKESKIHLPWCLVSCIFCTVMVVFCELQK